MAARETMSQARKWPAEGDRREKLQADNSQRAKHMVAIRDEESTAETRRATFARSRAINSLVPASYDVRRWSLEQGVLTTLHEMGDPYVKRDLTHLNLPEGTLVEGTYPPGIRGWSEQKQRKAIADLRVAKITAEDREIFGKLRDWGYSVDHIMLFSPEMVLYDDLVKAMKWTGKQHELMKLSGKAAAVSGEDFSAWHTNDDLIYMVEAMTRVAEDRFVNDDVAIGFDQATRAPELYGRRRLAYLLMDVARRGHNGTHKEIGLFHFWIDFLEHRLSGKSEPWQFHVEGWNPSKFPARAHKTLYDRLAREPEVVQHNAEVDRKRLQLREEACSSKRANLQKRP